MYYNLPLWSSDDNYQYPQKGSKEYISQRRKAYREANKERINRGQRSHYAANKDRRNRGSKEYRIAHQEQINHQRRMFYQENKEEISQRSKAYRDRNKEHIARQNREYRIANKERLSQAKKERHRAKKEEYDRLRSQDPSMPSWSARQRLKQRYNMSMDEWESLLEYQACMCAVCQKPLDRKDPFKNICVDHDHKTGKVRGLVHKYCNSLLALLDNAELRQSAINYVDQGGIYEAFKASNDRRIS